MESLYLDRPLNFAHRGASDEAPENTLAAFLRAIELGADGIELDVQFSQDRELVVIHNFTLETTTDGEGLVRDKTLGELKELDAGGWFDPAFVGQRIPTLQEVIDAVGDRLLFNIELKTKSLRDDGLAAAVVRTIGENHLLGRVFVSSFNPLAMRRVKRLDLRIPVGLLYKPEKRLIGPKPWLRHLAPFEALHPRYTAVDDDYMRWAKERGYRVHEPGDMRQFVRQGVDSIITSRPALLEQVLLTNRGQ